MSLWVQKAALSLLWSIRDKLLDMIPLILQENQAALSNKSPTLADEAFAFVLATKGSRWPHRRWSVVVFQAQMGDQILAHDVT